MRKLVLVFLSIALVAIPDARAMHPVADVTRVIVSTTLNSGLVVFDPTTLAETQFLPSRGGGPVRLWPQQIDGRNFVFAANHSLGEGSVGAFEMSLAGTVAELPLSPFPARPGPVGIAGGALRNPGKPDSPVVFVTNTWFALGGCSMPNGSVTAYDASQLTGLGVMQEFATVETSASIPWGVSMETTTTPGHARAFASSNCGGSLDTFNVASTGGAMTMTRGVTRAAAAGSDGTIWDGARALNYTANISANSVSVHDASSPAARTTVPIPGTGPIDITLADSHTGASWVITSNGRNDTVSLIDRDLVAACVAAGATTCDAEVARISAGVTGGAPEGVAYDPGSNRIFVVNKTPYGQPKLGVIQLTETPGGAPTGKAIAQLPLGALGGATPAPAVTAFDVVVVIGNKPGHP